MTIAISSLVFENDKWIFEGYFGHIKMSHLLKREHLTVHRRLHKFSPKS